MPSVNNEATVRRGRRLEFLTLAWNSLEAALAVFAGIMAGSIALMSFGLDSVIEVFSGSVLLWRLRPHADVQTSEKSEKKALFLVGISFAALAVYVAADSIYSLVARKLPESSVLGITVTAAAVVVMPLLARSKRKVASLISSQALRADSKQTDLCAYLSAITLVGLALNAVLGWWWADPAAALLMVPIISKEAYTALRGEHCNCADEQRRKALDRLSRHALQSGLYDRNKFPEGGQDI